MYIIYHHISVGAGGRGEAFRYIYISRTPQGEQGVIKLPIELLQVLANPASFAGTGSPPLPPAPPQNATLFAPKSD